MAPGQFHIPQSVDSLASFRAWYATDDFPENGRICYLGGEIWADISPELLSSHVAAKSDIAATLSMLASKRKTGEFFADGIRIVNEHADYSTEPDGCFMTWEAYEKGTVGFTKTADGEDYLELVGTPDMVLELVGPSSERKDNVVLPILYHKAGIPEYWRIDARGDKLSFDILHTSPGGYVPTVERNGWLESQVFGREFRIGRTRNRIDIWRYTLQMRPKT
jgi:Uma2 family endonuclease